MTQEELYRYITIAYYIGAILVIISGSIRFLWKHYSERHEERKFVREFKNVILPALNKRLDGMDEKLDTLITRL